MHSQPASASWHAKPVLLTASQRLTSTLHTSITACCGPSCINRLPQTCHTHPALLLRDLAHCRMGLMRPTVQLGSGRCAQPAFTCCGVWWPRHPPLSHTLSPSLSLPLLKDPLTLLLRLHLHLDVHRSQLCRQVLEHVGHSHPLNVLGLVVAHRAHHHAVVLPAPPLLHRRRHRAHARRRRARARVRLGQGRNDGAALGAHVHDMVV
mmetsp:Transcript_29932/g.76239  ORF Transcript_29932/g.76239 Transcript_29932/m.76239 type:complete len:207 (+) Transcript_29932:76-696(+)